MSETGLPDRYEKMWGDGRCMWCFADGAAKTYTVSVNIIEDETGHVYAAQCFRRRFCNDKCRDLFYTEP